MTGDGKAALGELRDLIRAGAAEDAAPVRELLGRLTCPLDLEAAGALLRGEQAQQQLAACAALAGTRIALLGSSTFDSLPALLTAAAVRRGVLPEIRAAGYNQWRLEIAAGAPELSGLRPRITACLLDDSAVLAGVADPLDPDQVAGRCAEFPAELADWAASCRAALGGLTVLATIPLSQLRRRSLISFPARSRIDAAWLRMNAAIADLAVCEPATVVIESGSLAAAAGRIFADDRMRHVAAHAYAPAYLRAYAEELAAIAAADLGRSAKCLVLDLDNTLWGGLAGEDGIAGLEIGGGYPGSAHAELQALARDLGRQGVLLAVCSKNDEDVAAKALSDHPGMLLAPESFAATRVNWDPKPDNVRAIAAELNIGLDAVVFADDSPAERDQMRRLAPEVVTIELPGDPAGYANLLAGRDDFTVLTLTAEDRERTAMYQAQARRRELERTSGSLEQYLESLESRLAIEPLTELNAGRLVQLFGKTNQFNLTGIRYGADELTRRAGDGETAFFGARLADRLGDAGLISAVALRRQPDGAWDIENMVLSCRVFGRGVEDAIIGLIVHRAAELAVSAVAARFRSTTRNGRFAGVYPRLGFREAGPAEAGTFRHDLKDLPDIPPWIEIVTGTEVIDVP